MQNERAPQQGEMNYISQQAHVYGDSIQESVINVLIQAIETEIAKCGCGKTLEDIVKEENALVLAEMKKLYAEHSEVPISDEELEKMAKPKLYTSKKEWYELGNRELFKQGKIIAHTANNGDIEIKVYNFETAYYGKIKPEYKVEHTFYGSDNPNKEEAPNNQDAQ